VRGPLADRLLCSAIKDPSPEVAIVAARAAAKCGRPGVAAAIASRLAQLDVDNADFTLASELIASLARLPEPAAHEALSKLADRRALIKRNHFVDVQNLVNQALAFRARAAGTR
jgi:hypothetical protein